MLRTLHWSPSFNKYKKNFFSKSLSENYKAWYTPYSDHLTLKKMLCYSYETDQINKAYITRDEACIFLNVAGLFVKMNLEKKIVF